MSIDYVRYLEAKRTVDDSAICKSCLLKFRETLENVASNRTLRIVELGAGTGTMLRRLLRDYDTFFKNPVEYTLVDIKADTLAVARRQLLPNCEDHFTTHTLSDTTISVHHAGMDGVISDLQLGRLLVCFKRADVPQFLLHHRRKFDAVIAASFLDLVSLDEILPLVRDSLDPSSVVRSFYFPFSFKGVTKFSSITNIDLPVIRAFHQSMGRGLAGGVDICRAFTGDYLASAIEMANGKILMSSDSIWNVKSNEKGYKNDELYFLQCILQFVAGTSEVQLRREGITTDEMNDFIERSLQLLRNGTLTYEAHNVDVCGVFPP